MQMRLSTPAEEKPSLPPGSDVRRLVRSMLQLLPSERASIADLCRDPWVVRDGELPPPAPVQYAPSGNGFVEGADVDGLVRARGLRLGGASWRTLLASLLGLGEKQMGHTHLAVAMNVNGPAASSSDGAIAHWIREHRQTLVGIGYAVLVTGVLAACQLAGLVPDRTDAMQFDLVEAEV